MKILFVTNYAAPYRVHFFDELGKNHEVTVLFSDPVEEVTHRSSDWFEKGKGGFRAVQLQHRIRMGEENLCFEVLRWLRRDYDAIVICGYSSPTAMLAMAWLRLRRIPFYMEVDGGLIREESRPKYLLKKALVGGATRWISTGSYTTNYLVHYGAKEDRVDTYPFSSLHETDILQSVVSEEEKKAIREELGIPETNMILSIGQFIHRKAFDVLIASASELDPNTGIYIVGGEPTEEYLELCRKYGLENIHFLSFMKKERLVQYYKACDLFVLPTREDIWGLVINEAMAYGLPVITTDRCVAGLELVENGVNGYIVPVEDATALANGINQVLSGSAREMGRRSLEKIRSYTIENMVKYHEEIFKKNL